MAIVGLSIVSVRSPVEGKPADLCRRSSRVRQSDRLGLTWRAYDLVTEIQVGRRSAYRRPTVGNLENKWIVVWLAAVAGIKGFDCGEVARKGISRHIGVTGRIDCDAVGIGLIAGVEAHRKNECTPLGVQFGNENDTTAGLDGVNGGHDAISGHVGVP